LLAAKGFPVRARPKQATARSRRRCCALSHSASACTGAHELALLHAAVLRHLSGGAVQGSLRTTMGAPPCARPPYPFRVSSRCIPREGPPGRADTRRTSGRGRGRARAGAAY